MSTYADLEIPLHRRDEESHAIDLIFIRQDGGSNTFISSVTNHLKK